MEAASGKSILIIRDERDVVDLLAFNLRFCQKNCGRVEKNSCFTKRPTAPAEVQPKETKAAKRRMRSQGKRYLCILAPPTELVYFKLDAFTFWICAAQCLRLDGDSPICLPMVRYFLALLSCFAVVGGLPGRADDVLPPRFNFDRYSAMVKNSPFAIATAVALPAATPDFAKDLYVANAAHSPEGDMATIASSSDQNFKKYLTTREPVDGYSIASIEWSEKVGATKVTISKDGKFATLTFNEALLAQASSKAGPASSQLRQGAPPVGSRQARTRGMIQRNPKPVAMPTPNQPLPMTDMEPAAMPTPNLAPVPMPNLEPPQIINPQQQQPDAHPDAQADRG